MYLTINKKARHKTACLFVSYKLHKILLLLGLLLSFSQGYTQTYFFDNYTWENGLDSKVYALLQSKNHIIWLGTQGGLTKFDGVTFQTLTTEDGLAEKGVRSIYEDSYGNIWFGHLDGGISRLHNNKLESLPEYLLFKNDISGFCEDAKGRLWVTSIGSGATLIKNPNASLEKLKYEHYQGYRLSDLVFSVSRLHDGQIYFITDVGLKVYDEKENNFDKFVIKGMDRFFNIICTYEDKDQNLWIGTHKGGLYKYNLKEQKLKIYDDRDGLSSNFISCITQTSDGDIWVGTWGGGITRIHDNTFKIYNTKNGLQGEDIYCIKEDAEGNVLIGTWANGLCIFKGEAMVTFKDENMFPNSQIWSIKQDHNGRVWFGTNDGVSIYDPKAKPISKFSIFKGDDIKIPTQVRYILEDKNHDIWFGTNNSGVYYYDSKSAKFGYHVTLNNILTYKRNKITAMDIDKNGVLWIGSYDYGLVLFNPKDLSFKEKFQIDGLPSSKISAIYIDKNNVKYVGSENKGFVVIKDTLSLLSPRYELTGNTTPLCFLTDPSGTLWIGTDGQGLFSMKNSEILHRYTQENDNLLSDRINLLINDNNNNIYIGSNRGLNVLNTKTGIMSTYTRRNGFTGNETKNNAFCRDKDGYIWFGTVNGAVRVDPDLLHKKPVEPLTHIQHFLVNFRERPLKKITHLSYTENSIVIDYSSVNLTNPESVFYQIMLEGADKDWQPPTKETSKSYSALAPGTYCFKLRAKNQDGIWNSAPVELHFIINPPFYQTWWFITICIFTGLMGIFSYIKIREKNLIREKRILEEKVEERTVEIVKINHQLAVKNKDITDSIQYASRIQNALLPPELPFENTFVLFKPKDIVSGDFFWFLEQDNMQWFAAVDCTGHGVPGAFMSIIGHNSLNKILQEYNITKPSEILDKLNEEVAEALHQYHQDNQIHDGMDIALASFDKETKILEYSGAFNPLWLIRNNTLLETRANRFAIGLAPGIEKDFTNHQVQIEPGDSIYLFSDGYADQFGGPDNKKLKIGTFKELIVKIQNMQMPEQKEYLENFFAEWKLDYPQVDDVLIIGRRFDF